MKMGKIESGGERERVDGLWRDRETTANKAVSVGELVGVGIRPAIHENEMRHQEKGK